MAGDLTLYAKWVKTWTVTFDTQDGTPLQRKSWTMEEWPLRLIRRRPATNAGSPAGAPYATGGTAYDFNGSQVTGDVTLTPNGHAPHTSGP